MAKTKDKDYNELLPPEGDDEVGKTVFAILKEVLDDKDELGLPKLWNRNHELVRNRHWKNDDVEVPLVSINLCHVHVQRTCNMMTDNNPTFDVVQLGEPEELPEGEDQTHDLLQKSAIHWWTDQEQQDVLDSSIRLGETNGIAIEKVIFNPNLEQPLGEIETVNVSPYHFGWYPTKLTDPRKLQQCDAVLHFYPLSLREARRRWPDKADLIKPDSDIIKELQDERRDINTLQGSKKPKNMLITIAETAKELFNWMNRDQETPSDEVLIVECWCHDYSTTDGQDEKQDRKPGDVVYKKAKYRGNIRCVVACNGDKVLEDKSNPSINDILPDEKAMLTYLWDKYPFSAANSVKDPANAWGATDLEQLEWLNHELNKSASQFVLEKDKSARSKIKNPLTSGVENEDFTNYYSEINPVSAEEAAAIQWLVYPGSSLDYQAAINMFKELFFTVAQSFEMDQLSTSSAIAYKTLAALMERQATMQRGKIRNYSRLIRDRGRMFLSHAMNWYTEPRYITYENSDGIKETRKIIGSEMVIPAKLSVVAGSTLPQSNVQKREEAIELFHLQAIDQPKLLEDLNVNGRKDIIDRMKQGPIGAAMNNLSLMGVPPELIQIFQQVAVMEPKDIDKAIQEGKIPPFQMLLQQLARAMAGQPEPQPQQNPVETADVQVKMAQAAKTQAETTKVEAERELLMEKIRTEKVDQRVKMAGVKFDTDKMQIEKARTVHDITRERKAPQEEGAPGKGKSPDKKPEEEGRPPQVSVTPGPAENPQQRETIPMTKETEAIPSGYNEAGMESNNRPQPEL